MSDALASASSITRLTTGIPGLDSILQGGLLQGGVYMVSGQPGTGKTILANQIAFHHVATGGQAVYVTLLTESHARMLEHIRSLHFFDPTPIADSLIYISGYETLVQGGLDQLRILLRGLVRDQRASLLLLDGLSMAEAMALTAADFNHFLQEIQVFNTAMGCTTLLLTSYSHDVNTSPEETLVDGLLRLHNVLLGQRAIREFEIDKLRGSGYLRGRHTFQILADGITIFPRTELLFTRSLEQHELSDRRFPTGILGLDKMLYGGLAEGSTTMVLGPPGSGKTCLGLQFLHSGSQAQQPGVFFGCYETAQRLLRKATQLGLSLGAASDPNKVEILWFPALEDDIDRLAQLLLNVIEQRRVRCLFIDGIDGFRQCATHPDRLPVFFTALLYELQARHVTTLYSLEADNVTGSLTSVPISTLSALTDNVITLHYAEAETQCRRLISIAKLRYSDYNAEVREFKITDHGIDVAPEALSADVALGGIARSFNSGGSGPSLRKRGGRR